MSTTPTDYRNDPRYKYSFSYGVLSHAMTVITERIERAKRDGEPISPDDPDLNWAIKQFKITDDNLHAEPKKETA